MIPNFGKGTEILSCLQGKLFLFFPKIKPSESNTTLSYDVAWDDTLTNIFHIFRYSLASVLAEVLKSV